MSRYASEVDVDFVRRSIKAIGQTAIKIDEAAERCVNVLLELINTRVSYVVQEAVVVMKVSHGATGAPNRTHEVHRISSENTPPHMRASSPPSARTSTSWTNLKPKRP